MVDISVFESPRPLINPNFNVSCFIFAGSWYSSERCTIRKATGAGPKIVSTTFVRIILTEVISYECNPWNPTRQVGLSCVLHAKSNWFTAVVPCKAKSESNQIDLHISCIFWSCGTSNHDYNILKYFLALQSYTIRLKSSKNRYFYFGFLIWPYNVNMSIDWNSNFFYFLCCAFTISARYTDKIHIFLILDTHVQNISLNW